MLDKEKDLFIKKKLQEDDLISRKADEVFNNFFKGEMKMNEEPKVDTNEKNENISKSKKLQMKKWQAAVASLVVIFFAANVYAATQGFNNIFFIIRDLIKHTEVTDSSEILSDKDLTISYQPIEIADGLQIMINRLVVKDNSAKLYVKITKKDNLEFKNIKYIVNDYTDGIVKIMANKESDYKNMQKNVEFEDIIDLKDFSDQTSTLRLEIQDDKSSSLAVLEIDLISKEIKILSNSVNEMKKISETELKQIMQEYAILNVYRDFPKENSQRNKEQLNRTILEIATRLIYGKALVDNPNNAAGVDFTKQRVEKAIKEFYGKEIKQPMEIGDDLVKYDSKKELYDFSRTGDAFYRTLCLDISSITFKDGIYTVKYSYSYVSDSDYESNNIENLAIYETTMKFKLNSEYEYAKYCLVDTDEITSTKIKEAKNNNTIQNTSINNGSVTNTLKENSNRNTVNYTNSNTISNTLNNSKTNTIKEEKTQISNSTSTVKNTTQTSSTNISSANINSNNTTHNNSDFERVYWERDGIVIGKPFDPDGWKNYRTIGIYMLKWPYEKKYKFNSGYITIPNFSEDVSQIAVYYGKENIPTEILVLTEKGDVYHISAANIFNKDLKWDDICAYKIDNISNATSIGVSRLEGEEVMVVNFNGGKSMRYLNEQLGYDMPH